MAKIKEILAAFGVSVLMMSCPATQALAQSPVDRLPGSAASIPQMSRSSLGPAYIDQMPGSARIRPPVAAKSRPKGTGQKSVKSAATIQKPGIKDAAPAFPTVGAGVAMVLVSPADKTFPSVGAGTVNR